jgi:hypothetical protein
LKILALGLLAGTLIGCGNGMYPVAGVVNLDGTTLPGAIVTFQPEGPGQPAFATTGSDGTFRVSTAAGPGAPAGEYRLSLSKVENRKSEGPPPWVGRVGKPVTPEERAAWQRKLEEDRRKEKEWVPAPYTKLAETPLRFTVPLKDELVIDLKSSEAK